MGLLPCEPIQLNARAKASEIETVTRLRIDHELLRYPCARGSEGNARSSPGSLGQRLGQLVAKAVIQDQPGRNLPRVLGKESECIAVDGCGANVRTSGKIRRRDDSAVVEGTARQQAGKRIR